MDNNPVENNPLIKRMSGKNKRNNKHGIAAEKKISKRLGATLTLASGALDSGKGDFHLDLALVESKSTIHDSLSLKYGWLTKISAESAAESKSPCLTIQFVTGSGAVKPSGSWVMIREVDFKEMMEHIQNDIK